MSSFPTIQPSFKEYVRAASVGANITLSGTQTVDGVALVAGDRFLAKDQTTGSQNGIYMVLSGAWIRTVDAANSQQITPGHSVWISEGTVNGATEWACTNTGAPSVGTTALTYRKIHPKTYRTVHTFALQGTIAVATVPPFFASLAAGETLNMVKARYVIQGGTNVTFKIQRNGADWTGYGTTAAPLTATTTAAETAQSNALADNDLIALVLVAISGTPTNLTVTCVLEHTT